MFKLENKGDDKMKHLLNVLNRRLKTLDFLVTKYDLCETRNLKLHDASYYNYSENEGNKMDFENFCSYQYDDYQIIEKENSVTRDYLGRTSSFYLKSDCINPMYIRYNENEFVQFLNDNLEEYNDFYDVTLKEFLKRTIDYNISYRDIRNFIQYRNTTTMNNEDLIKDFIREIENMIDNIKSIVNVIIYIDNVKSNQEEYFKEYIENNNF